MLHTSSDVVALGHMNAVYLYHQRYGYILEMSPDVHALWAAFEEGAAPAAVEAAFATRLEGQTPAELIEILRQFDCLRGSDDDLEAWRDAVPVKGAWNVWEARDDGIVLWTAWGDRPVTRHELSGTDAAIWRAIDGETSVRRLIDAHGADAVTALLPRLSAIDVQAIKLSPVPLSVYGSRRKWPPYLVSTMPYKPLHPSTLPPAELADYHRDIADADRQFDHLETTLAHLLRRPHPALGGRTYGAALLDGLERHGLRLTGSTLRVLEIGGGLGEVAASLTDAVIARGFSIETTICELSPALAARQRERTRGLPISVIEADALEVELGDGTFDLVIANEMIGDLPATALAEAGDWVSRYDLDVSGPPEDALLNTGAFRLLERAARWLAPGGVGVFSEFGERSAFPRLSTHLDHPEVSIHFGHLESVATGLGMQTTFTFLMDLIDLSRDLEGLSTTRSQCRALRAMLAARGIAMDKIGYTAEMFAELTASLPAGSFGDVRFDRIEDRLMGLVPHEFKALIVTTPTGTST